MSSLKQSATAFEPIVPLPRAPAPEPVSKEEAEEGDALLKEASDVGTSGAEKGGRKRRGRKTRKHSKKTRKHSKSKKTRKH